MNRFFGKKVLITGGCRRLGAALSLQFAKEGAVVFAHARCETPETRRFLRYLPAAGGGVYADLSETDCIEKIFRRTGPVDVLVNNASLYSHAELDDDSIEARVRYEWLNCRLPVALIERMAGAREGHEFSAVNILDCSIRQERSGAYYRSRRMLMEETKKLARQLAPSARINAVAPGAVLPPPELIHCKMAATLARTPLGRKVAVRDFVETVLFLAGNSSATGTILTLDCGLSL